jgi:hypothetical protein
MRLADMTPEAAAKRRAYYAAYARKPENIEKARARSRAHQNKRWAEDPAAMAAIGKAYREANPEKVRKWALRYYGITPAEFDAIYDGQGGKCAICLDPVPRAGNLRALDHCHTTHKIRGILCIGCNHAIGSFRERPDAMLRAIEYVRTADTGHVAAHPERLGRPSGQKMKRGRKIMRVQPSPDEAA